MKDDFYSGPRSVMRSGPEDDRQISLTIGQRSGDRAAGGKTPAAGWADAAHREAEAPGEIGVALILLPQQFDEYRPLPFRQGRDGLVETAALVPEGGLGAGIAFLAPDIDQLCHVRPAERYFPPRLGG